MPKLHVAFAESYEPSGPFGAKGLGEIGLDAIPAVIANAIADAVGVRIHELPITAEKIHRALHPELYADEKAAPPAAPKGGTWSRISSGQAVRRASARPGARARRERRGGGQAPRRRRSGARLRRHVACAAPRAHRLPAGEAPRLDRPHPGIERRYPSTRTAPCGQGRRCASRRSTTTRASQRTWPAIDDAMEAVGHTRIRHMLTVGGSLGPLDRRLRSPARPPRPRRARHGGRARRDGARSRSKKRSRSVSPGTRWSSISRWTRRPPAPARASSSTWRARCSKSRRSTRRPP